jgi:hypothetical protein
MTDQASSVNSTLGFTNPSPSIGLTGVPLADALLAGMERGSANRALMNEEAALHALPDRSQGQMLAMERDVGNSTVDQLHPALSNPIPNQIPREAIGLSSPALAPDQISSFANAVQIPQAWTEIKQEISPLHGKYLAGRNTLADSVMGNKLSTLAALLITPPLGLAALMNHKSSQQILQKISEGQVNFLVKAINGDASNPLGNLKQVLINAAQSLDVLNGLSVDTAKQVAESGSPAASAIKLAIGLFKAVDKSDLSVTSADPAINGTDIVAMRELLHESIALLDRPVDDIKSKIDSDSGVTALKVFVEAMTGAPAYIEGKYNKLRDPLEGLLTQKQSQSLTGFLGDVTSRVKSFFVTEADKIVEVVDQNANAAQAKMQRDFTQIAARISNSPELKKIVGDATHGLQTQVAPLMQEIATRAGGAIQDQLNQASNNIVFSNLTNKQTNSN